MPADRWSGAWGVIVPVKALEGAKTRLAPLGDDLRRRLALAFAQDVVRAAVQCPLVGTVLVVTDDPDAGAALALLGATVRPDAPGDGLNAAIRHGVAAIRTPDAGTAALVGDLPSLRPADLAAALIDMEVDGRAFVPDLAGTGTTLLAAGPQAVLRPSYGPMSRQRHRAEGSVELSAADGLRLDVDLPADLEAAQRLGVGPFTAAVLASVTA